MLLNKFTVNALSLIRQVSMLTVVPTVVRVIHFIKALTFLYKGHQLFNQVFFLCLDLNGTSKKRYGTTSTHETFLLKLDIVKLAKIIYLVHF